MLGQEFTELLAYTDFKSCQSTFPFVRSALCCAQMTAPKNCVKDGISKLLCKGDFDKLKSKGMQEAMQEAETCLKEAWELGNSHGLETDSMALPFGRMMIRLALFLTNKQSKGKEQVVYQTMGDINSKFSKEFLAVKDRGVLNLPGTAEVGLAAASSNDLPSDLKVQAMPKISLISFLLALASKFFHHKPAPDRMQVTLDKLQCLPTGSNLARTTLSPRSQAKFGHFLQWTGAWLSWSTGPCLEQWKRRN